MNVFMASVAESDQVLFGVLAGVAAKELVMDLRVRHPAAVLTSSAVATQHLLP
jgi:hypothetical protein